MISVSGTYVRVAIDVETAWHLGWFCFAVLDRELRKHGAARYELRDVREVPANSDRYVLTFEADPL